MRPPKPTKKQAVRRETHSLKLQGGAITMKALTKWTLLVSIILVSLWAFGQAPVVNEILPWIADNETAVWQTARPLDLFQRVSAPTPLWLPDGTIGVNVYPSLTGFPNANAARPQINASGQWLTFYFNDNGNGRVRLWDLVANTERQLIIGWLDTNNDGVRDQQPPNPNPLGILPAINGSGRIIAFLSQDSTLHDPDGDGNPANNNPPNPAAPPAGLWILYIHDRDADGNSTFDETKVGGTTTRFLPDPSDPTGNTPLLVRLTEVRLSLDTTGSTLAFSVFTGTAWQLYMADWQSGTVNLIATSNAPLSTPSVVGSRLAFSSVSQFLLTGTAQPSPPGVWVFDVTLGAVPVITPVVGILTNGVSGAPVLSRDGLLLAFHSTATRYQRFGVDLTLQPFVLDINNDGTPETPIVDRNGVDDVFVFNLTTGLPIWSTLLVRGLGTPPITLFDPCVNPALPSSSVNSSVNVIAFQQIVNGQSRVRVVSGNNVLR